MRLEKVRKLEVLAIQIQLIKTIWTFLIWTLFSLYFRLFLSSIRVFRPPTVLTFLLTALAAHVTLLKRSRFHQTSNNKKKHKKHSQTIFNPVHDSQHWVAVTSGDSVAYYQQALPPTVSSYESSRDGLPAKASVACPVPIRSIYVWNLKTVRLGSP